MTAEPAKNKLGDQKARAGDRVQPQQRQPPPALSRADCRYSGHPGGAATGRRPAGPPHRERGCTLARSTRPLPAADRAHPAQSQRRVLDGQTVPASEKLVSLFEPHADIIVKGARDVQYGHKLNLATGQSGLILDVVVEAGNPADAERFLPMLDRQITRCGAPP